MAKSKVFNTGASGDVEFNMTPMIDVTFQLIIFFVIAGQMSTDELAQNIELHRPNECQALKQGADKASNRVVVNVVAEAAMLPRGQQETESRAGTAAHYKIGRGNKYYAANLPDLVTKFRSCRHLAKERGQNEADFTVEVRADRRVNYANIEPIILAAMAAEIPNMNITALTAVSE